MSLTDDSAVAHINPDCREGKHRACGGDAWSMSADKPIDCVCPHHRGCTMTFDCFAPVHVPGRGGCPKGDPKGSLS